MVPYAYDRMPNGKPREGVPLNRLGSKARCDALINILPESTKDSCIYWFVLSAGYTKEFPNRPTLDVYAGIAEEMADYIESQGEHFIRITYKLGWGTYEETALAINCIRSEEPVGNEIYLSTNLGHMPRVWLCWLFLKPKGWKVRYILANHSFTWKERFQETAKFCVYLYRFLFGRW